MPPSPSFRHQDILASLGTILRTFANENGLGKVVFAPMDVVLSDTNVVQPDILFISDENRDIITPNNISGAPDSVEGLARPNSGDRDTQLKPNLYARYGVRDHRRVDPDAQSLQVMALRRSPHHTIRSYNSGRVSPSVIPCLVFSLAHLFSRH